MDDKQNMAELLFPHITKTPADYETEYPERKLADGAKVTRFAPSPTGFLHMGSLFAALIGRRTASDSDGVFYLRIEDTDKKREVKNGVSQLVEGLKAFNIDIDEGMVSETESRGAYGPYIQSKRTPIYQSYVKELVKKGLAYPCFMTEDEISIIREKQEHEKKLPGIYGEYAKYRNISYGEAKRRIEAGEEYVVRLHSPGREENRVSFDDSIKGRIEMPENILDVVLLKKDGTPTYHFAHAVDDHLMRTTDVIRGDEWISSAPIHLQLFEVLGFKAPRYAHIAPLQKEDGETGGKRKLSKRKDPEAAVEYYKKAGYPAEAVIEYLLTIANSNYEEWRLANPEAEQSEFEFSLSKMSKAGALFDLAKLNDVSKNYICRLSAEEVYDLAAEWAKEYNEKLYACLTDDEEYAKAVFSIERGNEKPRKDIAKWEDVENYVAYFYEELWDGKLDFADSPSRDDMIEIIETYKERYNENDSAEDWFPHLREMAVELGYAKAPKVYKKNPEEYKGHVGDVAGVIRAAVTGRRNTPDLYEIMQTLGVDEVMRRLNRAVAYLAGDEK
ncbi:MAG TPA: glutamate--tRNA ligase [Candidatus Ornithomonoglobus intestinigallinarum]|uniref:Glutamate--tRNA ligase n=1 Tax=Candidatus Ornithomonoglobus intestinigallinarum TaxID=2840894 RepID=A0A9D1H1S6_9FIRM|nr:glutamate--tRNA ligase [Candidatus Ornithomonoglobus intestinigallinarum]